MSSVSNSTQKPEEEREEDILQNTSRPAEEKHLSQILDGIRNNLDNYGSQVSKMRKDINEMLEHYHDDNPELNLLLNNTITLHDHMKRALERNEKALNKPYFGRIIFQDETIGKEESLYIGRGGISSDSTHQAVVDWRAPVANAYYENGLGKCSYTAPGGKQIDIDLKLKRTYEIEGGKLKDYFDSEVIANDELLTKYLAKNKQAVLGEIVATIQKEQNEIIRKSPYHNMIVQGVAGSGKTTVAMHRISFILYNYAERFRPDDFYIVGSNRILLNYITGVLPDLDVHGIRQMTMEQLFVRLLYEDWDEKKYRIRKSAQNDNRGSIKGSLSWFTDLKTYCDRLEWNSILRDSIYLNPRQFVEGCKDGKIGVYDETVSSQDSPGRAADADHLVLLVDGAAVERYILQTPKVSMQSKINMLNERLMNKVREEFLGKGVKYTESERKAILKAYRNRYGGKIWKGSVYELYEEFLREQIAKGREVTIPDREFDVYDLAALAYLYKRIKETEVISEAHHIVIDEAQDYGMMAYSVLHFCIQACTYTVMGDVSQNIHFGFGLNDWEELKQLLLPDPMDNFGILKKSYRNTVEISDFATNILHHGQFSSYPVEPIIRHGEPVEVRQSVNKSRLFQDAAEVCRKWQQKGFDTIAVVCRNQESADEAVRAIGKYVEVMENDLERAEFGNGIMVLPVEYTKGLEFDTVLILDPDRQDYPVDDGHAKLLYVAATRALHELCVLHTGNLTGLITDPLPAGLPPVSSEDKEAGSVNAEAAVKAPMKREHSKEEEHSIVKGDSGRIADKSAGGRVQIPQNDALPVNAADKNRTPQKRVSVVINPSSGNKKEPDTKKNLETKKAACTPTAGQPSRQPASGHAAEYTSAMPAFGDIPATEKLSVTGHSKPDMAVRWITKQPDGLYLQSRYGILRLSPIGSAIVRVSFVRNGQPDNTPPLGIAVSRTEKYWMYKDSGSIVELATDELLLQVEKSTGAVRYLTRDKKLLLAENRKECRLMEQGHSVNAAGGNFRTWLFLDWAKEERLYSFGLSLRGTARYISHGPNQAKASENGSSGIELPFLLSDKGYGILMGTVSAAFCCDIPAYGSYLYTENPQQMDVYFIAGKRQETILNAYAYLCGRL